MARALLLSLGAMLVTSLLQAQPRLATVDTTTERTSGAGGALQIVPVHGIGSPARDNSPIVTADGNVLFFNSTRDGKRPWGRYDPTRRRFDDDIYYAVRTSSRRDDEVWSEPINLGPTINSSEDDGVVSISPDGQTLYFNSLKKGWESDGGPFYSARRRGTSWEEVRGMGGGINDFFRSRAPGVNFRIYGGSISSDGRDFYFATTVHSPSGNHQIWVAHLRDGTWGYPENLGERINDGSGCYAPYIAADGRTLYFSSARDGGLGGDDIYMSVLSDTGWQAGVNIGAPINNGGHNAFLSIPASGTKAYFSMTVEGNEEIFAAPLTGMVRPKDVVLLTGIISDRLKGTPLEATIVIEDLATGHTIFSASSNSVDGRYAAVLRTGRDYGISISAPGYVFHSERYTIPGNATYAETTLDVPLRRPVGGENFVVNNIFFDYDQATLRPESKPELDRVVTLLREYPGLNIEVAGHTDNVGSRDYNMNLSKLRAEAVRGYLVDTGGIAAARINAVGYGDTRPIAPNSTQEGRDRNRRSEFRILE